MKISSSEKLVSTAKVVDGILILSLPDAMSPVVWQMELGQSKSSALEVRNSADGFFVLALKTPRQDILEIAIYQQKEQAIKALLATSQAMEKAQGQLKNIASLSGHYPLPVVTQGDSFGVKKLFKSILSILVIGITIVVGLLLVGFIIFVLSNFVLGGSTPNSAVTTNNPVSAEDFFENR